MTEEERKLIEKKYIDKLLVNCTSRDFEGNGANLDKILDEFLRELNLTTLADAVKSVECWRA